MKKATKNNKGFSLVELIVVVLIMAVIAVALAPQVTKWINRSKQATDRSNYESLIAECQLAMIDAAALTESESTITVTITDSANVTATYTSNSTATNASNFISAMNNIDSSWNTLRAKVTDAEYKITIHNGVVTRATPPAEVDED